MSYINPSVPTDTCFDNIKEDTYVEICISIPYSQAKRDILATGIFDIIDRQNIILEVTVNSLLNR